MEKMVSHKKVFLFFDVLLVVFCLALLSCENTNKKITNQDRFTLHRQYEQKISYLDGYANIIDIVMMDKYYIVQSETKTDDYQLSVYNTADDRCLYSFARRGHGHDEVIALDMIQNVNGDTLEVIDQAKYKIMKYCITPKKAILLNENIINYNNAGPLQEIYRINDSTIIFNTLQNLLCTYNDRANHVISEYSLPDTLGLHGENMRDADFHFAYHNKKICLGFRHVNTIMTGHIDEHGRIVMPNINEKKHLFKSVDKDMIYYSFVSMNSNNILAQFLGYSPGFIKKLASNISMYAPDSDIEIYTKQLKPLQYITMEVKAIRYKLSPYDNTIITWDPLDSKENIVRTKYEL